MTVDRESNDAQETRRVAIAVDGRLIRGDLDAPARPTGLVVFAHGSGSGRLSPRNRAVAATLRECGLATLLIDLLDEDEAQDRSCVFDIDLLASRLEVAAARQVETAPTRGLPVGYFGASTGAAAALRAAARHPEGVGAVVSRGGRPDLAWDDLPSVIAPTLLIVGGRDSEVLELNRRAYERLYCEKRLVVVPGATHLFPEPGALEEAAARAADWFRRHLNAQFDEEEDHVCAI